MSDFECPQESEILEALSAGRWSTPAATSLRAHAAGCAACNELAQLAGAILDERTTAMHEAALPGSGLVWWRIQMRMRQDASRAASRMMTVIQAVVVAGVLTFIT